MLTVSNSAGLLGIDGYIVHVECNADCEVSDLEMVGLPDAAVKEAKQRIRAASDNCRFPFPEFKLTVNLAPANIKKEGSAFDLAIFCAIMQIGNIIPQGLDISKKCFIGELSFTGRVNGVRGVLPMVLACRDAGIKEVYVPRENAMEAAVVSEIDVYGVDNVGSLVDHLRGKRLLKKTEANGFSFAYESKAGYDFSEVKGQERAKRALEIAAAGNHNILLIGPPGAGKSMLSKRIPTILPEMSFEEALVTTKIHSVSGLLKPGMSLVTQRPFRSPHHTLSAPSLVGGGKNPTPGEISIAHNGVLFLDELPEFPKNVTESLRQPLEDGEVTITRTAGRMTFPSSFMLVCAMNPCKCGYYGSSQRKCTCKQSDIKRYLSKISGPLLDRIDIHIELPAVEFEQLSSREEAESSADIRKRVMGAREFARERFQCLGITCNAKMTSSQIRKYCMVDDRAEAVLKKAFESMSMSARGYDRVLRVARTIADLEKSETVSPVHVAEAIQLRTLDKNYW